MKRSALLLAILSITLFAGCRTVAVIPVATHHSTVVTHASQHVYPPHNPRHGHRHHYYGHDLEYDTDFGAYMVLGYDGIFFYNDVYLRFYSGAWQITSSLNGTWYDAKHQHVPDRLRNHRRYNRNHRHSPPPHAPAHGHRYNHNDGVDLIFDSGIGVYIALGFDDLFFFDNHYMRHYDGYWHYADRYDGNWLRADDKHVPRKLIKARKHNKKEFFKKIRRDYKSEHRKHRENHEYRKKHGDRWNRRGHSDRKNNGKHGKRGRDHHDGRDDRKNKGKYDKRRRDRHDGHDDEDDNNKRNKGWLR